MKTPPFIALDGIDGSGKSTQSKLLCTALTQAGIAHAATREPGATEAGKAIREILLTGKDDKLTPMAEVLLFSADRALTVAKLVQPALEQGQWVVQDRSWLTTLIYQGYARGMDLAAIERATQLAIGGNRPVLQLIMDLSPEVGLTRKGVQIEEGLDENRFESLGVAFQQKVRDGFTAEARTRGNLKLIDASPDQLTVHRAVVAAVNSHFGTSLEPLAVLPSGR